MAKLHEKLSMFAAACCFTLQLFGCGGGACPSDCTANNVTYADTKHAAPPKNASTTTPGICSSHPGDCLDDDISHVSAHSEEDCCKACHNFAGCGAAVFVQGGQYGNTCYLKRKCGQASACHGDRCAVMTSGMQSLFAGPVSYCPDPETDFQEEVEDDAVGDVRWSQTGWTITGQRRVSSKAAFDFSGGGGVEWELDLTEAHPGVNNNLYVTYPYEENCGIHCYCDSGGNHDSQGRGCAELDWTENNGGRFQKTTWHDSSDGSDSSGHGSSGSIGSTSHGSVKYSEDGASVQITIGGNYYSGSGQAAEMKSRGAVIYSSQWQGWVPCDCLAWGDLASSVYRVKNLKITGRVMSGPEPKRCHLSPPPAALPSQYVPVTQ